MRDEVTGELIRRGRTALVLGLVVLFASTAAYYVLGCVVGMNARGQKSLFSLADDLWEPSECLYASAITVTTVGYTDLLGTERCETWVDGAGRRSWVSNTDAHEEPGFDVSTAALETDWSPWTRAVTSLQVIVGMGFFLYVVAQMTTFFAEGGHAHVMWLTRTRRQLARMDGHVLVCGLGVAARKAVATLRGAGVDCVVIDLSKPEIDAFRREHEDVPCLVADATEDEVLRAAGIERARAMLCLMPEDGLNLVALFAARGLAPDLHVVCRGMRAWSVKRLSSAGADTVIGIEALAGLRAASELIRPSVVAFLDLMTRDEGSGHVHFDGLTVRLGGATDVTLRDLALQQRAGLHAVAIRRVGREEFEYNPTRSTPVADGDEIVVLGTPQQVELAREAVQRGPEPSVPVAEDMTMEIAMEDVEAPEPHGPVQRRDHYVVCGAGLVGAAIVRELLVSGRRVVLVDRAPAGLLEMGLELPPSALVDGDALDPEVLIEAGVERARGLVTALPSDRDNLVVVVTALQLHPRCRTIAVAREQRAQERLLRAGAKVVALDAISGGRMAADVLRPHATTFLDRMRSAPGTTRFEGVVVTESRGAAGFTLGELRVFDRTGMRILALRQPGERAFVPNPAGDVTVRVGTVLIGVGTPLQVQALERLVGRCE